MVMILMRGKTDTSSNVEHAVYYSKASFTWWNENVWKQFYRNVHRLRAASSGAVSVWRAWMCLVEIFLRLCAVVPSGLLRSREHTAQFAECLQCPQQRGDPGHSGQRLWGLRSLKLCISNISTKTLQSVLVEKPKCVWGMPCVGESVHAYLTASERCCWNAWCWWESMKICTGTQMKHLNLVEINALLFFIRT